MLKKRVIMLFLSILAVLAGIRILTDWMIEMKISNETAHAVKNIEYCIFVEVEDKMLYLLQDNRCIKKYSISPGKSGLPSPLGCWVITDKGDWGEGFGGRWMGLNVPWAAYLFGTRYKIT